MSNKTKEQLKKVGNTVLFIGEAALSIAVGIAVGKRAGGTVGAIAGLATAHALDKTERTIRKTAA